MLKTQFLSKVDLSGFRNELLKYKRHNAHIPKIMLYFADDSTLLYADNNLHFLEPLNY